jgi:hypothetical protein
MRRVRHTDALSASEGQQKKSKDKTMLYFRLAAYSEHLFVCLFVTGAQQKHIGDELSPCSLFRIA